MPNTYPRTCPHTRHSITVAIAFQGSVVRAILLRAIISQAILLRAILFRAIIFRGIAVSRVADLSVWRWQREPFNSAVVSRPDACLHTRLHGTSARRRLVAATSSYRALASARSAGGPPQIRPIDAIPSRRH